MIKKGGSMSHDSNRGFCRISCTHDFSELRGSNNNNIFFAVRGAFARED
jgi:hypothetical protein